MTSGVEVFKKKMADRIMETINAGDNILKNQTLVNYFHAYFTHVKEEIDKKPEEGRATVVEYLSNDEVVLGITLSDIDAFSQGVFFEVVSDIEEYLNAPCCKDKWSFKTESYDYPPTGNREITYKFQGLRVRVDGYLRSDSVVCRRVQIGYDTVTVPKYELICQ